MKQIKETAEIAAYLSLNEHTSSMRKARSARVACVTHFSTTFDANLCCDSTRTLLRTLAIRTDLSSGFPCSIYCDRRDSDLLLFVNYSCFEGLN